MAKLELVNLLIGVYQLGNSDPRDEFPAQLQIAIALKFQGIRTQ